MGFFVMVFGAITLLDGFDGTSKTIDQRHQYEIIVGLVLVGLGALMRFLGDD